MFTETQAMTIATDALIWLAAEDDRLGGFLASTGAAGTDIRARAEDPEFLGFVLDHLLSDEGQLLDFARDTDTRPEHILTARAALPGGDLPHWT